MLLCKVLHQLVFYQSFKCHLHKRLSIFQLLYIFWKVDGVSENIVRVRNRRSWRLNQWLIKVLDVVLGYFALKSLIGWILSWNAASSLCASSPFQQLLLIGTGYSTSLVLFNLEASTQLAWMGSVGVDKALIAWCKVCCHASSSL